MPFLVVMGLFGLGIGFLISSLDPFIYNEKVRLLALPNFKNTTLGFLTIMSLIMALLAQPLVGQWSDRMQSRWGNRTPYFIVGVIGVSLSLILIVVADTLLLLILGAMLVSTFSNTTQAVWQALIPDHIPEIQHGTSAGIKTIFEIVGAVGGVVLIGFALSRGNLWGVPLITVVLFFVILLITLFTLSRSPSNGETNASVKVQKPFFVTLRQAPRPFYWWMVNRFLFWSSAIAIRTFMLNYLEDVMGIPHAQAQALGARLFVALGIGVFILALPAGVVADKIGRRTILVTAGVLAAAGSVLFIIWPDLTVLYIAGGLIAVGTGIFASASWALATDLTPKTEGALYLGLANSATVLGSIGGRTGGAVIDGFNQLFATVETGYVVVFCIAALFFVLSSVVVLKIPERKT